MVNAMRQTSVEGICEHELVVVVFHLIHFRFFLLRLDTLHGIAKTQVDLFWTWKFSNTAIRIGETNVKALSRTNIKE